MLCQGNDEITFANVTLRWLAYQTLAGIRRVELTFYEYVTSLERSANMSFRPWEIAARIQQSVTEKQTNTKERASDFLSSRSLQTPSCLNAP
jgi:hypothetical protein